MVGPGRQQGTNQIPIPLSNGDTVEPDAMFGLAINRSHVFFLVEADRRIETIRPNANPNKNSYWFHNCRMGFLPTL